LLPPEETIQRLMQRTDQLTDRLFDQYQASRDGAGIVPANTFLTARSLVLELVGPAGAGKSSLLRVLSQRDQTIRAGLPIPRHRYVAGAFPLLPTFLDLHRPYRRVLWKEMKRILYLETLHKLLKREASGNHKAIIFDEGPVYMLSRIQVFGHKALNTGFFEEWWHTSVSHWANLVDVIVWLDADDSVLAQRLRTRNQQYPIGDTTDRSLREFLARYRLAFERVISELTACNGPKVIRFTTHDQSIKQIADKLICGLDGEWSACRPLA
jgi:deoxyadenosine/deoxycytidine kinase